MGTGKTGRKKLSSCDPTPTKLIFNENISRKSLEGLLIFFRNHFPCQYSWLPITRTLANSNQSRLITPESPTYMFWILTLTDPNLNSANSRQFLWRFRKIKTAYWSRKHMNFYYIDIDEIPQFFLLLKNHIFIAWRYYFYLSHVMILVSPWLLTWLAKIFLLFIRILTFRNIFVTGIFR